MFKITDFLREQVDTLNDFNNWLCYVPVEFVREFSYKFNWKNIDINNIKHDKWIGDKRILKEFKKELGL